MFLTNIRRILKYGWLSFWRNRALTAASLFIMVMLVSLVTSLILLQESLGFVIARLEEKVNISVYFEQETDEQDILELAETLRGFAEIKEVEYVSQEMAMARFSEWHKDDSSILESLDEVGDNSLPASLNITTESPLQYAQVSSFLETGPFKDLLKKVDYGPKRKEIIERLFSLTSNLNTAFIVFALILGAVTVVIVFNQIQLAICDSRKEIEIMRLVGSPNFFVWGPFLVQAVLLAFFAVLITILIFTLSLYFLSHKIGFLYPGLNVFNYFKANFLNILFLQIAVSLGIAGLSSYLATRKYLKI